MEAICSFETSVVIHQTTRRHIPEDDTLQAIRDLKVSKIDTTGLVLIKLLKSFVIRVVPATSGGNWKFN
jgi:hypothetical protein